MENVASSWTHAVLEQVLVETTLKDFPSTGSSVDVSALHTTQKHTPGVYSRKEAGANFNFPQGANTHPNRSSSLQRSLSSSTQLTPQVIYENERYAKSSPSNAPDSTISNGSGVAILASGRAQLLLMQRKIIEALAKEKGWQSGWDAITATQPVADIALDGEAETEVAEEEAEVSQSPFKVESRVHVLLSAPLLAAISSLEEFRAAYEVCIQVTWLVVAY